MVGKFTYFCIDEWYIWISTESVINSNIALVFHIEQPVKVSKLFPQAIDPVDIEQKLKRKDHLKAIDAHPKIVNKNTIKKNMPWMVTTTYHS